MTMRTLFAALGFSFRIVTFSKLGLLYCFFLIGLYPHRVESTSYSSISSPSSDQLSSKYFDVKPSDVYVIEGESAELKCQISSKSDAGPVQWAKDGFLLGYQAIIPGYDRYVMSVNDTSRTYNLHIANAQLDDEAEFECQTSGFNPTSGAKQPIRASAFLHLIVSPKSILINSTRSSDNPYSVPNSYRPLPNTSSVTGNSTFQSHSNTFIIEAHEAEKIIIVCSVAYSKPPPRLKWYRKNTELLPEAAKTTVSKTLLSNRHTLFSVESSLVLYPKSDEEYRCQVEHPGLSKPLRATAQINIFRKPTAPVIEGYKNGDIVNFQEKLTLKCTSTNGYPPPSVVWFRNGVEKDRTFTQTSRHEVVNTFSFVVEQSDNLAQLTCQVGNVVTPVPLQQSVTLNVLLFPTQVRIIAPSEVLLIEPQGSPVTLECQAHPASPSPNESKIRWLIDGKEVNLEQSNYVHVVRHDQQSWTVRSNLTFVVNSKEPSVRNIACIGNRYDRRPLPLTRFPLTAYSTNGKSETVSAAHQISVIYPPELPTLLGVKNGLATVVAGEIFKCKCVSYSGNPRANLLWLNHKNREISALTTTTGSGISSELVIRPSATDHGAVFRCHVLHPALEKPYEVSFTLQVLFGPEQLNITFPKFIKENDTIKIECTASPSNPCPTITLLKDGKKMDGDNNVMIEKIADRSNKPWHWHQDGQELPQDLSPGTSSMRQSSIEEHRFGQSVPRQVGTIYKTDCATLHNNGTTSANHGGLVTPQSVKAVVLLVARAEDDESEITCLASSALIPSHAIRTERSLTVHYKPKFNNYVNLVQVNEQQSHQLSVTVRANPFVDNLVFSRVKETTPNYNRTVSKEDPVKSALNDLIDDYQNISWLLEPVPSHWSWTLSRDIISLNIHNATVLDAGLYVARVSNTLGDSLFFTRLLVKTVSSINSMQLSSSSSPPISNQSDPVIREGDKYLRIECRVTANPSITVQWTKQHLYQPSLHRDLLASNVTKQHSSLASTFSSEEQWKERFHIDWSRSNVSQSVSEVHRTDSRTYSIVSRLTMYSVSFADAGIYTCVTPNDTRQIRVQVEHRPRILPRLNSLKVAADRETSLVKFVCSALAYPISYFNWTVKDNQMVSGASGASDKYRVISRHGIGTHRSADSEMNSYHFTSELIIRDVSELDFARYECVAFNQMGTDRATFELVHKSFPESPSNLQSINVTHNSAFLTWDSGFDYGHEQYFQLRLWHIDKSLFRQLEQSDHLLDTLPSRTFANLTVNYHLVGNLEPDTYYRLSVVAMNRLGQSAKNAYLTIHTLSSPNYLLKPVYASADEQKLNGLIANSIIGEDFLELSVILCLILLLVISLVTSTFIYCRKRRHNQGHNKNATNSGCSQSQCSNHTMDPTMNQSSKFALNSIDYVPDNAQTPTVSSSLSNQLTGMGFSSEMATNNSLSTTSSYVVKDDFISPLSSSYCRPLNNFDSGQCKYLPAEKGKLYSEYLTISSLELPTGNQNETSLYPYELTGSCAMSKAGENEGNFQLLLSHQQITNVHLLPETLGSESICLNREASPLTEGYIFGPIQYEPSNLDKANLCSLPLSSFDLSSQFSLESASSPSNLAESQSFAFVQGNYGPGNKGEYNPLLANSTAHANLNLYDMNENISLAESSLPAECATLKSNAIKRVNLVKASNSSISATLTTLNEEDEV